MWEKRKVNADPFPFRVGKVRVAYPGWLNGKYTVHDPRPEFDAWEWYEVGERFVYDFEGK